MTAGAAAPEQAARNSGAVADRSGPAVARVYHRLLAAIFLIAWVSLGIQVDVLIGSRGLMPAAELIAAAHQRSLSFVQLPTLFWLGAPDWALKGGTWLGAAIASAALLGWQPRWCAAASTALYLSYASVSRNFLSFQWDNLLLECGLLAVFLPTDRPARWIHLLFRLLLFKLYWESGVAKWQSHLGDWQDGSAMTFYYETAPLPVWPAWYAHHWPRWWHHFESWAVLVVELVLPFLVFGPRLAKLVCAVVLTGFQLLNLATANYGFFVYLSVALHVFLLTDRDMARLAALLPSWLRRQHPPPRPAWPPWRGLRIAGASLVTGVVLIVSVAGAISAFAPWAPGQSVVDALRPVYAPWRLINTYHLFGHITRDRIEPEFQVQTDGTWQPLHLRHKPGDVNRAPDLVAPHQPRVDFQLWFYGLSFQRGMPSYVSTLLDRLCHDPQAVQPLFASALPPAPTAVRIEFWRYHFAPPDEATAWWTREPVAATRPLQCT